MLTLKSPAKINLFLRILKRRPDGYHEIASLFQTISLCDILHFTLSEQDQLTCTDLSISIPLDNNNLILKAVDLFRRKTQLDFHVNVHVEKNIPIQAGLGGGSSNAATTLWALNELLGKPASIDQLITWSSEIGSDITFFLSQGTAYCTGRGEIIQNLPPLKHKKVYVVKPLQGLSTPEVYKALKVDNLEQRNPEVILNNFCYGNFTCFNDLESSAFEIMPELAKLQLELKQAGFEEALMSGSGSAFFCLGEGDLSNFKNHQCFSTEMVNRLEGTWY